MLISLENQTDFDIALDPLLTIASELTDREVELMITDNLTIQTINAQYRDKNQPTDVLSFPLEGDFEGQPLGTIIISIDFVHERATELGHTAEEEFTLLFIHGLLHLLGYDHEVDNGEMRAEEERLIKLHALPTSLIVRNREG